MLSTPSARTMAIHVVVVEVVVNACFAEKKIKDRFYKLQFFRKVPLPICLLSFTLL